MTSVTWNEYKNLHYADLKYGNFTVKTVYDTLSKKFYISLTDVLSEIGFKSKNIFKNERYLKYFSPINLNLFKGHTFIKLNDLANFMNHVFRTTILKKVVENGSIICKEIAKKIIPYYKNGKIKKISSTKLENSDFIVYKKTKIHYFHVDGKTYLSFPDVKGALGMSRRAGISDSAYELTQKFDSINCRVIEISTLPIFASRSFNIELVRSLFEKVKTISSDSDSFYKKEFYLVREHNVAVFNSHTIKIIFDDGKLFYRVSDLAKPLGFNSTNKGLAKFSTKFNGENFVTKKDIGKYVEECRINRVKDQYKRLYNICF